MAYQYDFKYLKSQVGIDDAAYSLGYRLDRKAGVGRYIELVLGNAQSKSDTIIIGNHRDKASQFYFRRDGQKGDVIKFISENIHAFNAEGRTLWDKVGSVMARLANMPEQSAELERIRANAAPQSFDPARFDVRPVYGDSARHIFEPRCLSSQTVGVFRQDIVMLRDLKNTAFNGFNVAFPYRQFPDTKILGFEVRGARGYKGKAAGTNSSTAAWVAVFPKGMEQIIKNVYFFESAFDAMAFRQANARLLDGCPHALVSVGGTMSDEQVKHILQAMPQARPYDCFDNDIAGVIYGIRLACLAENKLLSIAKNGSTYTFAIGVTERQFDIPESELTFARFAKEANIRYRMGQWKAPHGFKDWNEVLTNPEMAAAQTDHKLTRDIKLRENRNNHKISL